MERDAIEKTGDGPGIGTVPIAPRDDARRWRRWTTVAALPCALAASFRFGWRVSAMVAVACAVAAACELGVDALRRRRSPKAGDGSRIGTVPMAFLPTGLLFALLLPPATPLWMVAVGAAFAVLVGQEIFGGTDRQVVSPPLVGLSFLMLSYPATMVSAYADVAATSLDRVGLVAVLAGGALLLAMRAIDWRIVFGALAAFFLAGIGAPLGMTKLICPTMLFVTFFLATDPVTCPSGALGRLLFGVIVGAGAMLLRRFTSMPDDAGVAVLAANLLVPFVNRIGKPREARNDADA